MSINFKKCTCWPCDVEPKFPILWTLSDHLKWYEIPKNGSYAIKEKYFNIVEPAPDEKYRNQPVNDSDVILVVWRDPVDRFKSLFMHYFLEEGLRFDRMENFFTYNGVNLRDCTVQERIEMMLLYLPAFDTSTEVHHFYPQTYFVDQQHIDKFEVLTMSEISPRLKAPHLNFTRKDRAHLINFTKIQTEYIMHVYKDDYEFYNRTRK